MSDFDPYLKWLGIREKNLPINHYRLLGLDLFEDDPDVISMAADRQMTHIRTYQNGPNGDISQQILNELARARRCLLVAEKKAEYDAQLSTSLSQSVSPPVLASPSHLAPPRPAQIIPAVIVEKVPPPVVQPTIVASSSGSTGTEFGQTDLVSSPEIGIRAVGISRAKTKRRENKQFVWSLLGWISGGLAAVGVAAALIGSGIIGGSKPDDPRPDAQLVNSSPKVETAAPRLDETTGKIVLVEPLAEINGRPMASPKNRRVPLVQKIASPSELYQPDPFDSRFDLSNLTTYPKAGVNTFALFGDVKRGLRDKKTVPLEQSALANGELIRVTPDAGAIVIGLAFTTNKVRQIASIRPIFHDGFRAFAGNVIGSPGVGSSTKAGRDPFLAIARPGFSVGEIDVSAVKPVRCFRIKFMKIGRTKLDTTDVYFSKWFGRETGPRRTIRNENGLPVVGVYASLEKSGSLSTLSLVGLDLAGNPEVANIAGLTNTELPTLFRPNQSESMATDNGLDDGVDPFAVDPADSPAKAPEPNSRARAVARKSISNAIQSVLDEANDVRGRIVAADQLIKEAQTQDELMMKYVYLKEAEELGIAAGDARTAVEALRGIDKSFEIDFWKEVQKTTEKAARNMSNATALDFKDTIDGLIDEAKDTAQFDAANKLLSAAIKLARRAQDAESTNEYLGLEKEVKLIKTLTEDSTQALVALAANPDDPKANLDQGDFLFVLTEDLAGAFEHWKKCNDKQRVEIVELESQNDDSDGTQIAKLAEAWRAIGESQRTLQDRKSLQRAYELYRKASFRLTGLEQQAVKEKIDELSKIIGD